MATDNKMLVRVARDGKLLLLKCLAGKGKIALGKAPCEFDNWHIAIKTQDFQHPGCIDFTLTNSRGYASYGQTDTGKYSKCYVVKPGIGSFDVMLRWADGHFPYPDIELMTVWVFGVFMGTQSYPKADNGYTKVAEVEVKNTGQVLVNGRNSGYWPEMLVTQQ